MTLIPIQVECYSGSKADETPRRFTWEGRVIEVQEVVDRWYQVESLPEWPRADYFKVQSEDGGQYLLKHDLESDEWYLGQKRNMYARAGSMAEHQEISIMKSKNTICLWFDKDALEAARFYAATFPDSKVTAVYYAPADYPNGKAGDVLMVEFTVFGIPCVGLNGGPAIRHSEAFSFQIATDNQEETDRYWNAIVRNGGEESECGWCKDRWGLSWQITPRALTDAVAAGGGEAKRAFEAMMTMKKIDVAKIEAARRG